MYVDVIRHVYVWVIYVALIYFAATKLSLII